MDKNELLRIINKADKNKVTALNLSGKGLTALPSEIGNLKNLKELWISNNQLTTLPHEIGKLTNLTELYIGTNQLKSLPPEIGKLSNLKILWCGTNQLKILPPEIGKLSNLMILLIDTNQLTALPHEIGNLTNLQQLHIYNNQLTALPHEIGNLKKLKEFTVSGNPLKTPAIEIASKGIDAIREYFELLNKKPDAVTKLYEAKLIIVGQGGVGKTSILRRLTDNTFSESQESTEGIEIKKLPIKTKDSNEITLNVWDFGGQEIYHATHQFFLTKRSVYMLVWDARQEAVFGRIEDWLNVIKAFGEDSPIILVLNKCDTYIEEINSKDLKAKFPNIMGFLKVSSKTPGKGPDSFSKLKKVIGDVAAKLPLMGTEWVNSWIEVRKTLEDDKRNYIDYPEFKTLCREHDITESEESLLAEYLHDLGVFLHFKDDVILRNTLIIKPAWGTHAVYKVVASKKLKQGVLCEDYLPEIWKDTDGYPNSQYPTLLRLMRKFELSFAMGDTNNYIIPSVLPREPIDFDDDFTTCTHVLYQYEFLPKNVMPHFIVRVHDLIKRDNDKYLCWRDGVILSKETETEKTSAYIKADESKRLIDITVTGESKREFLWLIRQHFDTINEKIKQLKVDLLIPCSCTENCPSVYKYENVRKFEREGKNEFLCMESTKAVSVKELLNGIETTERRKKEEDSKSMGDSKFDVFISHSSNDAEFIMNNVLPKFKSRRISYWIDHEQISFGDGIVHKIEDGLQASKHVMVCLSPALGKSNWCRAEYESVLHKVITKKTDKKVIPLKLRLEDGDDYDTPILITGLKMAEFYKTKSFES
ncbi:MAG: TIR domain-containing protein [Nitrospirae bacterium]|nr:TIR domain-containing protein [Nitrospirota bacterium]MBF0535325.1 TIR domain-containing protein [Nitrospirota bacterium]MBF0617252.1 TIR domain-containing protein [Nitrospirota bacterium]